MHTHADTHARLNASMCWGCSGSAAHAVWLPVPAKPPTEEPFAFGGWEGVGGVGAGRTENGSGPSWGGGCAVLGCPHLE